MTITIEDFLESNRIKKEAIENLRRDLQGTLSQTQLDKLEEIFLSCSEGYIFRRKGNRLSLSIWCVWQIRRWCCICRR